MKLLTHDQTVRLARPVHRPAVSAVLAAAFAPDPVFRWAMPGVTDAERQAALGPIVDVFVDGFVPLGATFTTATGAGAALWAPPGTGPDLSAVDEVAGAWPRFAEVAELLESTHPHEPCWYLNLLAVEPSAQGQGIGSALLATVLRQADRDGVPAYLEATSEHNRRLYERHGFAVTGELRTSDCPPLWAMWRRT